MITQVSRKYESPGLSTNPQWVTGWVIQGHWMLFETYSEAVAWSMGMWNVYCKYYNSKHTVFRSKS